MILKKQETVTEAMLTSRFNTRSNVNPEFLRVIGANPQISA